MSYILKIHRDNEVDLREVAGPNLVIGRGVSAQLRLDDGSIDFHHAHIEEIDGKFIFSDNGSVIGSYVNGIKLQTKQLIDGDRISIGPYLLIVNISGDQAQQLSLDISTVAQTRRDVTRIVSPRFDYAAAYSLHRPFCNKTVLTLALVLISVVLLLMPLKAGIYAFFRPAAVSKGHAIFADQCMRCHQPWRGVAELRCQECHGVTSSVHQKEQPFTPSCQSCHREHFQQVSLVTVADAQCWQCHADLKTKSGGLSHFQKRVTKFSLDHPEFTIPVKSEQQGSRARMSDRGARQSDPSTIKLNHQVHLKPNLKGPDGSVQLRCKDCHQPAMDGTIMLPVKFASHCQSCHPLEFEANSPGRVVPHQAPEIIEAYLSKFYFNQVGRAREVGARLFKTTCAKCHELEQNDAFVAVVKPPAMPVRWFASAQFAHQSHRVIECGACHTRATKSRRSSDVLIPGIQICQECHKEVESRWLEQKASAPVTCTTCHDYHQRAVSVDWDGPLNLRQFREASDNKPVPNPQQPYSYSRYLKALLTALWEIPKKFDRN